MAQWDADKAMEIEGLKAQLKAMSAGYDKVSHELEQIKLEHDIVIQEFRRARAKSLTNAMGRNVMHRRAQKAEAMVVKMEAEINGEGGYTDRIDTLRKARNAGWRGWERLGKLLNAVCAAAEKAGLEIGIDYGRKGYRVETKWNGERLAETAMNYAVFDALYGYLAKGNQVQPVVSSDERNPPGVVETKTDIEENEQWHPV